jgi:hypothetical protein
MAPDSGDFTTDDITAMYTACTVIRQGIPTNSPYVNDESVVALDGAITKLGLMMLDIESSDEPNSI